MMRKIQRPAVAGLFYPLDPADLRQQVSEYLAKGHPGQISPPKALIAPHAGYIYSGPIAGHAYAQLEPIADQIKRVVIMAPSHRMAFAGLALSGADVFRTPLGDIEVDQESMAAIQDLPQIHLLDEAFSGEHSLEVHLPFLQMTLKEFSIVPLLVSNAGAKEVEEVLEKLWGGDETLIVISSDLSHYLDYESARTMDQEATLAIENLEPEALSYNHACGRIPVTGLLEAAKKHHLKATTLDLRNSGDTAGSRDQVVGYGAYAFS